MEAAQIRKDSVLERIKISNGGYVQFRTERFVDRTVNLAATIKKNKICYVFYGKKQLKKSSELSLKDFSASHINFEIARSRGMPISEILQYNIFEANSLFDDRGYTQKP